MTTIEILRETVRTLEETHARLTADAARDGGKLTPGQRREVERVLRAADAILDLPEVRRALR